jgi:hypothetical protein
VSNLFRFESESDCNSPVGSPKIVPAGGGKSSSKSRNFLKNDSVYTDSSGFIDVVNNFHWTSSQLSSRQDIPAIILKERRLKTNALISQLAYYSMIATGKGGEVGGRLANLIGNSSSFSGPMGNFLKNSIGNKLLGVGQTFLGAASNFGSGLLNSGLARFVTGKSSSELVNQLTGDMSSSDVLEPYEGLYNTEETRFQYRMPYFSSSAIALQNAFNSEDAIFSKSFGLGQFVGGAAQAAESAAYALSTSTGITEPGIYIEKPQFYNFSKSGESIQFSFPLINTGWATFEDVQRNWQLIYMLVYQNRANRKSRDLIDPPCLYEVLIPGVKFTPYSFISRLTVDFMGARRSYYINAPSANGGTSKIQTIIPDAYMVTITLQSLLAETQNFLYHMLQEKQNVVNVLESTGIPVVDSFINGLTKGLNSDLSNSNVKTQK